MVVSPRLVTPGRTADAHFDSPRKPFFEFGGPLLQEPALGGLPGVSERPLAGISLS